MELNLASGQLPERVSYWRATLISLASVAATWVMTALTFLFLPHDPQVFPRIIGPAIFMATVIPLTVSFPVVVILQRGRVKLAKALKELEEAHGELSRRSRIDPLTGLLNREALLSAIEEKRASDVKGAMLMVDIDHFKSINDSHGHHAGDDALKLIADALSAAAREGDLVGRLGGEEFGIFVPCETVETARIVAERIRTKVALIRFHPKDGVTHRITTSIGIAFDGHSIQLSDMMKRADTSLYDAKESGRNRIVVHRAA